LFRDQSGSYSSIGRLLKVVTPTDTIEYKHNVLGNQVAKLFNGEITEKYLWQDKTTLLAIYDKDDTLIQRFEYSQGQTPTAFVENGQRYYILTDQIGTPRLITDESGSVVKEMTYDTYGNVIGDSNPNFQIPFGYAGGLKDNDTGLIRFGYRDYDPEMGRWTARDPIGFAGGDTNLYGYVGGNPIVYIDPLGLQNSLSEALNAWSQTFPSPSGYWEAVQARKEANQAAAKVDAGAMSESDSQYMGPADAIRHCVLSCSLTQRLGTEAASNILDYHESSDTMRDMMDEYNNQMGCFMGENSPVGTCEQSCFVNISSLMTHRNEYGEFLSTPQPIGSR
jgi:RHS repeat-associated protein